MEARAPFGYPKPKRRKVHPDPTPTVPPRNLERTPRSGEWGDDEGPPSTTTTAEEWHRSSLVGVGPETGVGTETVAVENTWEATFVPSLLHTVYTLPGSGTSVGGGGWDEKILSDDLLLKGLWVS